MVIRDGEWTLFEADIKRGRNIWYRYEPDGSKTYRIEERFDKILDANADQAKISKSDWGGDWHHVARVPQGVAFRELVEAHAQGDEKYLNGWLNDSDNAAWRTKGGKL